MERSGEGSWFFPARRHRTLASSLRSGRTPSAGTVRFWKKRPFCLNDDGIPTTKHDGLRCRGVITTIKKSTMTHDTLDVVSDLLSWSFNALTEGIESQLDWKERAVKARGTLVDGWKAVFLQNRGDWKRTYPSTYRTGEEHVFCQGFCGPMDQGTRAGARPP